jgi:L,D-transpeptidase catalytic domain
VSFGSLLCFFALYPVLISGTHKKVADEEAISATASTSTHLPSPVIKTAIKCSAEILMEEADAMYDSIQGKKIGLSRKAFECAWKGYKHLQETGQLRNNEVLSICDFSLSSRRKRMFIIDVAEKKLLMTTWVAHGRNSGGEYARSFSNSAESHKSSLGFYVTRNTYFGDHGLALKIKGLENGINDKADERNIVIHGSEYVGSGYLQSNRVNGRSFGCPAVPVKDTEKVISTIKGGSCLFIYHPTTRYLSKSKILND